MADGQGRIEVLIPYKPRKEFIPLHNRSERWAIAVCHRRAGKTVACVNELIKGALTCARGKPRFAYCAPQFNQAKDVAWDYLKRFCAAIPGTQYNESELRVDLPNEGRIRLYGLENYDRLRGLYLDGIVLDEFGDIDPQAWESVIRPTLSDRGGWAIFIGTPKGQNHFADLWDKAGPDPDWFKLMLKVSETKLIGDDELADVRKTMSDDQYEQEYECSFSAATVGAYYGREIQQAENDKRICPVPWEPDHLVHTAWDIGIGSDTTAIWFAQIVGKQTRLIDYLESSSFGLDWYAKQLRARPYVYGEHIWPHDGARSEWGAGKTRQESFQNLGFRARIMQQRDKPDSINGARLLIPKCIFDAEKCAPGIKALKNYRRDWDDKRKVFSERPLHDWASHGADAFAELAAADIQATSTWGKKLDYSKISKGIV